MQVPIAMETLREFLIQSNEDHGGMGGLNDTATLTLGVLVLLIDQLCPVALRLCP